MTKRMTVVPSPRIDPPSDDGTPPLYYVRGLPAKGATLPAEEAQALIDAGLAVPKRPRATKPRTTKPKPATVAKEA